MLISWSILESNPGTGDQTILVRTDSGESLLSVHNDAGYHFHPAEGHELPEEDVLHELSWDMLAYESGGWSRPRFLVKQ